MILKHENTCVEKYVKGNFCWVELLFISFFCSYFCTKIFVCRKILCVYFFFKGKLKNPSLLIELEKNTFS